jgi:hypothetical protein
MPKPMLNTMGMQLSVFDGSGDIGTGLLAKSTQWVVIVLPNIEIG